MSTHTAEPRRDYFRVCVYRPRIGSAVYPWAYIDKDGNAHGGNATSVGDAIRAAGAYGYEGDYGHVHARVI